MRKTRNTAVHTGSDSVEEAKLLLSMTYNLAVWFMETYGDWGYIAPEFVMPEEKSHVDLETIVAEQEKKIAELSQKAKLVYEWTKTLNESLENAGKISDITKLAFHYKKKVLSSMQELRKNADILETLVAGKYWPYPTYGELLFGV